MEEINAVMIDRVWEEWLQPKLNVKDYAFSDKQIILWNYFSNRKESDLYKIN